MASTTLLNNPLSPYDNWVSNPTLDDDAQCAICAEDTESTQSLVFHKDYQSKVSHVFHEHCLKEWIERSESKECPFCNQEIESKHLYPERRLFTISSLIPASLLTGFMLVSMMIHYQAQAAALGEKGIFF